MLTAHFDDSWNDDVFVVAGFVAPAEKWALFSDEWRLALSLPRGVPKLVANEAMKLRGAFHGFSKDDRDKKLSFLSRIIMRYVSFELFVVIPMKEFNKEFENSGLPKIAGDPYYPAMMAVIRKVANRQITLNTTEKMDFVFDEKKKQQARILAAWTSISENQSPEMRMAISSTPRFVSDDYVLPLQAADWAAWHRREQGILGAAFNVLDAPWRVPVMDIIFTPEIIRLTLAEIADGYKNMQQRGHLP